IIEIEAGDTPLGDSLRHPEKSNEGKQAKEMAAMKKMEKEMPSPLGNKAALLFKEFEECRTMEAKFARAIDQLDAVIHEMDYKADWKGWSSEFLIEKKMKYFEQFPGVKQAFEKVIAFAEREGYFSQ
ncbi:MAG: HD domain-containing protein, partial [Nanoarchaeota archaeon]